MIQVLRVQWLCFKEAGRQLRLKGGRPPNPWADVAVSRLRRSHPWPHPGARGLRLFCPFFQLEFPSLPCRHGPRPCAPLSVLSAALWFPLGRGCFVTLGRVLRMPFLAKSSQGNPPPLSGPLERLMASEGTPGLLKLSSPGCCGAQPSLQASLLGAGGGEDREGGGVGGFCWELQGPRFSLEAGDSFPSSHEEGGGGLGPASTSRGNAGRRGWSLSLAKFEPCLITQTFLLCPPSPDRAGFMQACESAYSSWKFSGGFRTWVKMSLVETKEEDGREAVEFRQEVGGAGLASHLPWVHPRVQVQGASRRGQLRPGLLRVSGCPTGSEWARRWGVRRAFLLQARPAPDPLLLSQRLPERTRWSVLQSGAWSSWI